MQRLPAYQNSKVVIGWREWMVLPDLGIPAIKVKVDTGARTSALHSDNIEFFENNSEPWVRFRVYPLRNRPKLTVTCTAPLLGQRMVRDSGGHPELRYVIVTKLSLHGLEWESEITLTSRKTMLFRMLLGRTAINRGFLLDPNISFTAGPRPPLAMLYPKIKIPKRPLP